MTDITADRHRPLIVDLDGTLTPIDTLHEAAVRYFVSAPLRAPVDLLRWLRFGKAQLKARLEECAPLDPARLPFTQSVLDLITQYRALGRQVVLCTASDTGTAERIAAHLGCFDLVMASDGTLNLAGSNKAAALVEAYGHGGFDYVGNSSADLPVWEAAGQAYVASNDSGLVAKATSRGNVAEVLEVPRATGHDWIRQLRLHQWVKNALLFVPLIAAQKYGDPALLMRLVVAFVSFGIIASSTYLMNDLFDLEADRAHVSKRSRPLAAGLIPTLTGVSLVPLGLVAGLLIALVVSRTFMLVAAIYIVTTMLYSFHLKRLVLIDCICLAGLFTLRVVAGSVVIAAALSQWLFLFSIFLFLSLAFLKRYVELREKKGRQAIAGRGYITRDLPLVLALGVGAGYAATVVLSLYLFSPEALAIYGNPYAIMIAVPVLCYWLSYMWMVASRGDMHHDPVLYALRDRHSLGTVAMFFTVFVVGAQLTV